MNKYTIGLLLMFSCAGEQTIYCSHTCVDDNVTDTSTICGEPERSKGCGAPDLGEASLAQEVTIYRAKKALRQTEDTTVVQVDDSEHFWVGGGLVDFDLGAGVYAVDGQLLGIVEDGDYRWRFVRAPR